MLSKRARHCLRYLKPTLFLTASPNNWLRRGLSTEVESPRLSQLFGDAVRKSVGLRYRKQWRARFDSIDNAGLQVTKLGRCIDFTRLGDMAGFHWWRCGFEARGFTCGVVGGGVGG